MRVRDIRVTAMSLMLLAVTYAGANAETVSIYQATLSEPNQKTEEVSTEQLRRILSEDRKSVV